MSTTEVELDAEISLEEGELQDSDVEDGTYIPLARPEAFDPPSLVRMQIQDEPSDEGSPQESLASESDEEHQPRAKRSKIKVRQPQAAPQADKKNKYNVWCSALQEDILTEDMVSCDVSKKFRYGVESYDYTIKYRLDDNYISKKVFSESKESKEKDHATNKRKHCDRSNVKLRLGKKVNSHRQNNDKHVPRFLPDLSVSSEDPVESIGADIAQKLSEEKQDLVGRIVEVLGANKAIEIYKETQKMEAEGGMLVMNGTRRRTPGGIYFFLLKRDEEVSQDMVSQIFNEERKEKVRKIKKSRAKSRQKVMEQLKQSLTDSELPSLMSRGEATAQTEHGSNPPPSPETDARDGSSDTDGASPAGAGAGAGPGAPAAAPPPRPRSPLPERTRPRPLQGYEDDDFLEVMCNDDMDMF